MRALPSDLRKQLETSVLAARRAAESASRASLEGLGVFVRERPGYLNPDQAALRNGLRAKWRQLGGDRDLLVAECAYEQWHRLLFARFLAENSLLLHPQYKVPVALADCEELAAELGEPDGWSVAAGFAAEILPGIFRLDDPCVRMRLAPEGRYSLEQILYVIPAETFEADDALGWVYQFWQKDKKDEVNDLVKTAGLKIGGAEVGPVTELFTENYMVRFLLENSLGAWWAARHPDSPLVQDFDYLRFAADGRPAIGSFDGWPDRVAKVTVMDPCCGSGHFLVESFSMLWRMRAEEEGIAPIDAQDAVLRDSLFGLELDARCVQIAMFAVALQAWKAGGGWRQLPVPNIACSGIPVKAPVEEWRALGGGDQRLENALVRLHILFRDADTLGSLIDPRHVTEADAQRSFDDVDWEQLGPLLQRAVDREEADPATQVLEDNAVDVARAARYLSIRYVLVVTNVPYRERRSLSPVLFDFIEQRYFLGRYDLGTAFIQRCVSLIERGGSIGMVTPQNWLFLKSYSGLREWMLTEMTVLSVSWLGPRAFQEISGEVVQPALILSTVGPPDALSQMQTVDVRTAGSASEKAVRLATAPVATVAITTQRAHPDSRILPEKMSSGPRLSEVAYSFAGIQTSDYRRFGRLFWEVPCFSDTWIRQQSTVKVTQPYGGRQGILRWERGEGELEQFAQEAKKTLKGAHRRGLEAWEKNGVVISQMGSLAATLYTGEAFDNNVAVIIPTMPELVPAIWEFVQEPIFASEVRKLDPKMNVTNATLAKIAFDERHWTRVASALPEPWSDDPTQWLFKGRPEASTAPLQVAVARLVGYRWPEQVESDDIDVFADADGIVCLPSVAGEAPAGDRVHHVLAATFDRAWSPAKVKDLLELAGGKKKNIDDWLRDDFFKQHCAMFENRPFVWHIWDGLRDGFAALVNCHRLDRRMLEKLTYTYLGQDWVERQRAAARDDVTGAAARLSAALGLQAKLEAILEGEKPYDIFVRWKELHEQPIGWEPDLNDGVRLNIRPFVQAGVLRSPVNIHWKKDRGKNPDGSERHNEIHVSLAEKRAARERAGQA
jgi:hypothetical protein